MRLLAVFLLASLLLAGCAQEQPAASPSIQASGQPSSSLQAEPSSTPQLPSVEAEQPKLLNYDKPDSPIAIKYYSNWRVSEEPMEGVLVSFIAPKETPLDAIQENLQVVVSNMSAEPVALDEYTTALAEELNKTVDNLTLLDSRETVLAGEPGWKLVYSATTGNLKVKFMLVYAIKDDVLYDLTYNAEESKYGEYLPTIQEMIDSFEIR